MASITAFTVAAFDGDDDLPAGAIKESRSRKVTRTERVLDRMIARLYWLSEVVAAREWRKCGVTDHVVESAAINRQYH